MSYIIVLNTEKLGYVELGFNKDFLFSSKLYFTL